MNWPYNANLKIHEKCDVKYITCEPKENFALEICEIDLASIRVKRMKKLKTFTLAYAGERTLFILTDTTCIMNSFSNFAASIEVC